MGRYLFILLSLAVLAGCQTTQQQSAAHIELMSDPNSNARLSACSRDYGLTSKKFADCWAGKALTRQEACRNGSKLLDDPYLSDWRKAQLFETMRNGRCMG